MSRHAATRARYYLDNKHKWTGYRLANKDRIAKQKRDQHARNPDIRRNQILKGKFGMTAQEYDALLLKQDGVCAICAGAETVIDTRTGSVRRLAVDHDHTTQAVRGLLCSHCNRALGLLGDNTELLARAIQYLKREKL